MTAPITRTPQMTISSTPPVGPLEGDLWWNTLTGVEYIWYNDGDSSQWVATNPFVHTAGIASNLTSGVSVFNGGSPGQILGVTDGNFIIGEATVGTGAVVRQTDGTLTNPHISTIYNAGTLTLPALTDTLVARTTVDTLTNKSISGSTNTLTNIPLTSAVTGLLPVANGGTNAATAVAAVVNLSAEYVVDSLAALTALTARPSSVMNKYRSTLGDGGGGVWVWRSGNQSANVTADPGSLIWAPPDVDQSGASGAWQRQFSGPVHIKWRCAGSGTETQGINDWLALGVSHPLYVDEGTFSFDAALNSVSAHGVKITGAGRDRAALKYVGASTTVGAFLTFGDFLAAYQGLHLSDFSIGSSTAMGAGCAVRVKAYGANVDIDVDFNGLPGWQGNLYNGLYIDASADINLNYSHFYCRGKCVIAHTCIELHFNHAWLLSQNNTATIGAHLGGGCGGIYAENATQSSAHIGFLVDNGITNVSGTGDTHTSTTLDNLSVDTSTLSVGWSVTGTNIPVGTTIATITSYNSVTLSQAATGSTVGGSVSFARLAATGNTHSSTLLDNLSIDTANLTANMVVVGSGIPANTFIAAILSSSSVQLSQAATTTVTGGQITFVPGNTQFFMGSATFDLNKDAGAYFVDSVPNAYGKIINTQDAWFASTTAGNGFVVINWASGTVSVPAGVFTNNQGSGLVLSDPTCRVTIGAGAELYNNVQYGVYAASPITITSDASPYNNTLGSYSANITPVNSGPYFNVVDFGAHTDGSTDSYAAFAAAVTAAASAAGTVLVPPRANAFITNTMLVIPQNVNLQVEGLWKPGASMTALIKVTANISTVISGNGTLANQSSYATHGIWLAPTVAGNNLNTIKDVTLYGFTNQIYSSDGDRWTVDGVFCQDNVGYDIRSIQSGTGAIITNFRTLGGTASIYFSRSSGTIEGVIIDNFEILNTGAGVAIQFDGCLSAKITNGVTGENNNSAIVLNGDGAYPVSDVAIEAVYCSSNPGYAGPGIYIYGNATDIRLTDITATTYQIGIKLKSTGTGSVQRVTGSGVKLSGNTTDLVIDTSVAGVGFHVWDGCWFLSSATVTEGSDSIGTFTNCRFAVAPTKSLKSVYFDNFGLDRNTSTGSWVPNNVINVKLFGATGDGTTNDTAAIQAAVDYASGIGGGTVFIPNGVYYIATTVSIVSNGVDIVGESRMGTRIKGNALQNTFSIGGSTGTYRASIRNMQIDTSFTAIRVKYNSAETILSDLYITSVGTAIQVNGDYTVNPVKDVVETRIQNVEMEAITTYGVYAYQAGDIYLDSVQTSGTNTGAVGVLIDSGASGFYATDCNIRACTYGWLIRDSVGIAPNPTSKPTIPNALFFENCLGDSCVTNGWYFQHAYYVNQSNCWGAGTSAGEGMKLGADCYAFQTLGFQAYLNNKDGLRIVSRTGKPRVSIVGGEFVANSQAGSGTYHGINVEANTTNFSIVGVAAYNDTAISANQYQGYGIYIVAGTSNNYVLASNNCVGNATGTLFDGGTGTTKALTGNLTLDSYLDAGLRLTGNLTYGGTTFTGVTGSTSLVGSASPTFTGTVNTAALTASGAITSTKTSGGILTATSLTTNNGYLSFQGTGGNVLFGTEGSAAGATFTGSAAYATLIGSSGSAGINFAVSNAVQARLTATGFGVGNTPSYPLDVTGQARATTGWSVSSDGSAFTPGGLNAIPNYGVGYITSTSTTTLAGFGGISLYTNQTLALNISGTGLLTSTKTSGSILTATSLTTNNGYLLFQNTGGNVLFGVESSVGGTTFTGSTAYAALIGGSGAAGINFAVSNVVRASLTSATFTSTVPIASTLAPATGWLLDADACTITVANGSNAAFAAGSGLIIVTNPNNGQTALYSCGGGTVTAVSAIGIWVAPTTTPAGGTCSVQWDGAAYRLYNNYGSSQAFKVMLLRTRASV